MTTDSIELGLLFLFSPRSWLRLAGVRPELVALAHSALVCSDVDFGISEGVRSLERQRMLVAEGRSWTLNSRHLTGHAIDVFAWVDGRVSWDVPYYRSIYNAFEQASDLTGVEFRWGGDFDGDGVVDDSDFVHFQLPWRDFPVPAHVAPIEDDEDGTDDWLVPSERECA